MSKKLGILELARKIEEQNEIFNAMSKAEKRVQIAKDCLERMKFDQFKIEAGVTVGFGDKEMNPNKSVKEVINKKRLPECEVCAKGGLFMCYVGRVNDFTFGQIDNDSNTDSTEMTKLREIFKKTQLNGIEAAFEKTTIGDVVTKKNRYFLTQCEQYRNNIDAENDKEALISICKNIIIHNGKFRPDVYVSWKAEIE